MQTKSRWDQEHPNYPTSDLFLKAENAYAEAVTKGEFKAIEADNQAANQYFLQFCNTNQKNLLLQLEGEYKTMQSYAIQYAYSCGILGAFEQLFIAPTMPRYDFDTLVVKGLYTLPQMELHTPYYQASNNTIELSQTLQNTMEEGGEAAYHVVSIECAWEQRIHISALTAYTLGWNVASSVAMTVFPKNDLTSKTPNGYFTELFAPQVDNDTGFFRPMNNRIA